MKHSQWTNSHDEKQSKGGLRHRILVGHKNKASPTHKSEWFFDVFLGEYANFIGLYKSKMQIDGRASSMLRLNVGLLHLSVEIWRPDRAKRYG